MGRIDDAMRRAAEERRTGTEPVSAPVTVETFPAEAAESAVSELLDGGEPLGGSAAPLPTAGEHDAAHSLIQRLSASLAQKIVVDEKTTQLSREQYRKLAATLHQNQAVSGLKVVMIASAMAGEGKTLTSSNLALTLSESYKRRVLLIDGDLRRPSLHTLFGIDGGLGLGEGLHAENDRRFAVHEVTPHLMVLPAGRPSLDPMAGLTSDRMQRLIDEARTAFDWVIVDTPPVGLLPDGHLLTSMVDGVLLVVKAGDTPYSIVQRALESLGRDKILGVVLNQAAEESAFAYYSYRYQYGTRPETAAP